MHVEVKSVLLDQKPVLQRLMQLYLYDFSEFDGHDISREGFFEYRYLDFYWTELGRFPFLIHVDGRVAGFALVRAGLTTPLYPDGGAQGIAEFFVMRKYRRQGVGKSAAFQLLDRFPGKWEVSQIKENLDAQKFWRKIIGEYTNGQYREMQLENDYLRGTVQCFDNSQIGYQLRPKSKQP